MKSERNYELDSEGLDEGKSLFSRVYNAIKHPLKTGLNLGLSAVIASSPLYATRARAYDASAMALVAYSSTVAAPANSGPDTDGDGLADAIDPYPNDAYGRQVENEARSEIPDGVELGGLPPDQVGVVTTFYNQLVGDRVAHQSGQHEFVTGLSADGTQAYFIRATAQAGGNGGTVFADPVLYIKALDGSGSERQLTQNGDLGDYYEFHRSTGNRTNDGVYIESHDPTGAVGDKILEVFDTATSRVIFQAGVGRRIFHPWYYNNKTLGEFVFFSRISQTGDPYTAQINARPMGSSGLLEGPTTDIVNQTVPAFGRPQGGTYFPTPSPDGKRLAWVTIYPAGPSNPQMAGFISENADLENIISNIDTVYDNTPTSSQVVIGTKGIFVAGWSGNNLIMFEDPWENAFALQDGFKETNILSGNTDFDLYIQTVIGTGINNIIRKPGNQFSYVFDDVNGIIPMTEFDAGGKAGSEGQIKYALLQSGAYFGAGGTTLSSGVTYTTDTGTRHTLSAGTIVFIPDGGKFVWEVPTIDITDPTTFPEGTDTVVRQYEVLPDGTTFTSSKAEGTANVERVIVNKELLNLYQIDFDTLEVVVGGDESMEVLARNEEEGWIEFNRTHYSDTSIVGESNSTPGTEGLEPWSGVPVAGVGGLAALVAAIAGAGNLVFRRRNKK